MDAEPVCPVQQFVNLVAAFLRPAGDETAGNSTVGDQGGGVLHAGAAV